MTPASSTARTAMVSWLNDKAGQISLLEQEAEKALYEKNDRALHHDRLVKKARLLAAMEDNAAPLLADLPAPLKSHVRARLAGFSRSAETALALDSVFFMAALLYPDDHRAGQPTNLDALIQSLEEDR